jgi:hypothetical protein
MSQGWCGFMDPETGCSMEPEKDAEIARLTALLFEDGICGGERKSTLNIEHCERCTWIKRSSERSCHNTCIIDGWRIPL